MDLSMSQLIATHDKVARVRGVPFPFSSHRAETIGTISRQLTLLAVRSKLELVLQILPSGTLL